MQLDIAIRDWPGGEWKALARRAAEAAQSVEPVLANARLETCVLFTNDAEVQALNCEWRGRDKPTNVLSFPMLAREDLLALAEGGPPEMLGDIAMAHETCLRESSEKGIVIEHHAAHLLVHGLLHLAGHDHETSEEDADKMERIEVAILAKLGIPDPYVDRI